MQTLSRASSLIGLAFPCDYMGSFLEFIHVEERFQQGLPDSVRQRSAELPRAVPGQAEPSCRRCWINADLCLLLLPPASEPFTLHLHFIQILNQQICSSDFFFLLCCRVCMDSSRGAVCILRTGCSMTWKKQSCPWMLSLVTFICTLHLVKCVPTDLQCFSEVQDTFSSQV